MYFSREVQLLLQLGGDRYLHVISLPHFIGQPEEQIAGLDSVSCNVVEHCFIPSTIHVTSDYCTLALISLIPLGGGGGGGVHTGFFGKDV